MVLESLKPAEDGSGDVIVRLYESVRTATACELRVALPFRSVLATSMLESDGVAVPTHGAVMTLQFRPFEIKTLRLVMA